MKRKALASALAAFWLAAIGTATAQSAAINYQGRLADSGSPANGTYDLRFILYTSDVGGSQVGSVVFKNDAPVSAGLFTVDLDFGPNVFTGSPRWMEIAVRPGTSTGLYTPLNPRQAVAPTPYALFSSAAGSVASGVVGAAQLAAGAVGNTNLQNLTITASKVASGQVVKSLNGLRDDIALAAGPNIGLSTNGNTLLISGSGTAGGAWTLNGNSGTVAANFIGTTDNRPLEFKVNGQRVLRLEPTTTDTPNLIAGAAINTVAAGVVGATISGGGTTNDGASNSVASDFGTISGGRGNRIQAGADDSVISGGVANAANSMRSTIGGSFNTIQTDSQHCTIAGGVFNVIQTSASDCTIGGGNGNIVQVGSWLTTIAGGAGNTVGPDAGWSVIGGGMANAVQAFNSIIAGGNGNRIRAAASSCTISGGVNNTIDAGAIYSTIGGGAGNTIESNVWSSTISGGHQNTNSGDYTFTAGNHAHARHSGAFVWSDGNGTYTPSTNNNSVTFRANGGYRLLTSPGNTGAYLAPGSGSWTSMSDRESKENFSSADSAGILAKVANLPVNTWNYKSQSAIVRHIGPTAQDFKAAFGVGDSDTGITQVDADGVALAAIQGLAQIVKEKDKRIDCLERRLAALEALVNGLAEKQPDQEGNRIAR